MQRRNFNLGLAATLATTCTVTHALAALPPVKVGLILPLTGGFTTTGKQIEAGIRLYMAQHGSRVAGRTVELVLRDDGGMPDVTRRIAQEMVVNDKVHVLAGFGLTPVALSAAPVATQAKIPMVVMAAATSSVTEASPYIVRTGFTLPQVTIGIAEWASKNGIKSAVSLVADYGPGYDAEKHFKERFQLNGGRVSEQLRTPVRQPDFAPALQRVRDASPDALFVFLPSGQGAVFMKQFVERGLNKSGIQLIATGDVTDDDQLNGMGDAALGVVNSHHYSAAHPSALNTKFVTSFEAANKFRPNFMAVAGWDGMRVIYKAVEAAKGKVDGDGLLVGMKGQIFESPRGEILIDAQTRDIVQDVYIRKVERRNGQLWNIEFDVLKGVKDPGKAK